MVIRKKNVDNVLDHPLKSLPFADGMLKHKNGQNDTEGWKRVEVRLLCISKPVASASRVPLLNCIIIHHYSSCLQYVFAGGYACIVDKRQPRHSPAGERDWVSFHIFLQGVFEANDDSGGENKSGDLILDVSLHSRQRLWLSASEHDVDRAVCPDIIPRPTPCRRSSLLPPSA